MNFHILANIFSTRRWKISLLTFRLFNFFFFFFFGIFGWKKRKYLNKPIYLWLPVIVFFFLRCRRANKKHFNFKKKVYHFPSSHKSLFQKLLWKLSSAFFPLIILLILILFSPSTLPLSYKRSLCSGNINKFSVKNKNIISLLDR